MPGRHGEAWMLDEARLRGLTAEGARDLVVEWFMATQGSHFLKTKSALGVSTHDAALARTVKGAVRLAFRRVGGDFDRPSAEALKHVVNVLAEKSLGWGTPEEQVLAQHAALLRAVSRVRPATQ